jgi:hypothetical protein
MDHVLSKPDILAFFKHALTFPCPYGSITALIILTGQRRGVAEHGVANVGIELGRPETPRPWFGLARQPPRMTDQVLESYIDLLPAN